MDRTELTIVAAAALMVALGLGWVLRWIYSLLNPPPAPEPRADSEWAQYAKACEAQRDAAQARLAEVERDMGNKLTQAQAELSAAMEGLAAARRATQDLEARLAPLDTVLAGAPVAAPPEPPTSPADEQADADTASDETAEAEAASETTETEKTGGEPEQSRDESAKS